MHTIRKDKELGWLVQVIENGGTEPGYRPHRATIAKARDAHIAALVASWLNGGEHPGGWLDAVEWVGGN